VSLVKRNTIIFDSESETVALMDFSINEYSVNGKKPVELYKENITVEDDIEKDLLDGMVNSYTSLFKIIDKDISKNIVILKGLINNNQLENNRYLI
jgi:CRISPR/Cas system CMR subunit Cmr6 (Cas7 group RAMP superfamily)